MVRIALSMCAEDLRSPADVFADAEKGRLLFKKGTPITDRVKDLLSNNNIDFLEFPLPFETSETSEFTFSEKTETALFEHVQNTYKGFKKGSVKDPLSVRKEAYDILTEAAKEFQAHFRLEHPVTDAPPRRSPRSILRLRTVGLLEDYLYEHAKNVALTCLATGYDFFHGSPQILSELHKVAVAGLFADIGMTKVPTRIIQSRDELTDKDRETVHKHVQASTDFTNSLFRQKDFITAKIVEQHHERNDGSGYPAKRKRHELEPHAQLLAVVDSYLSMVSKRYFRAAQHPVKVLQTLNVEAVKNRVYDEAAVKCLNYRIAPYPVGSVARFGKGKLIHVVSLETPLAELDGVKLLSAKEEAKPYNMPEKVCAFSPKVSTAPKTVAITEHLGKLGEPLDTFDLLVLYGYTTRKK